MVKVLYNGKLQEFKEIKMTQTSLSILTEEADVYVLTSEDHILQEAQKFVLAQITKSINITGGSIDIHSIIEHLEEKEYKFDFNVERQKVHEHEFNVLVIFGSKTFLANQLIYAKDNVTLVGKNTTLRLNINGTPLTQEQTIDLIKSLLFVKRSFARTALNVEKLLDKLKEIWNINIVCEEGAVVV